MATLQVPGATLSYQTLGSGPLIVFIAGARGEGAGFQPVAQHLAATHKVLTYDRRGYGGSKLDGPPDDAARLRTDADDVARLIKAEGDGPAIVFGSSSGAIVALQVLADHPDVVVTLLAHEPPALRRLPPEEAEARLAATHAMVATYRAQGLQAALGPFIAEVMSPSDRETLARIGAQADPAQAARNFDHWFEHELRQYPATEFDDARLRAVADRLIFVAGDNSAGRYPHRLAVLFASQLGVPLRHLPGGHIGFTSFGEAFARGLSAILAERAPAG